METLKEVFAATRERISSPLIGTFALAWCIANWPLFVGLSYLNEKGYQHFKAANAVEYVANYLHRDMKFWWPLTVALVYSFGYPFVKSILRAVRDKADVLGEKWNLKIAQTSKIDTTKFLRLRESYLTKEKQLQRLIDEEESVRAESDQAKTELLNQKSHNNGLLKKIGELELTIQQNTLEAAQNIKQYQFYSPYESLLGILFEPAENAPEFIAGSQLMFVLSSDKKKRIALIRKKGDMGSRLDWTAMEACCDFDRKASLIDCVSINKESIISNMDPPILPYRFSMFVKETMNSEKVLLIVIPELRQTFKLLPVKP